MNQDNTFFTKEPAEYENDPIINGLNFRPESNGRDKPHRANSPKELTEEDLLPDENIQNGGSKSLIQTIRNRFIKENFKVFSSKRNDNHNKRPKVYSLTEVFQHNQENDCWIVIGPNVYDVTQYLDTHPGGDIVIMERAGMDATRVFLDQGHSSVAKVLLEKYLIGQVDLLRDRDLINHLRPDDPEEIKLFPFILAVLVFDWAELYVFSK